MYFILQITSVVHDGILFNEPFQSNIGFKTMGFVKIKCSFGDISNAKRESIIITSEGRNLKLFVHDSKKVVLIADFPLVETVTVGRNGVVISEIKLNGKSAEIDSQYQFDGEKLFMSASKSNINPKLKESEFLHFEIGIGQTELFAEIGISFDRKEFLALEFAENCLFTVRFAGNSFRKSIDVFLKRKKHENFQSTQHMWNYDERTNQDGAIFFCSTANIAASGTFLRHSKFEKEDQVLKFVSAVCHKKISVGRNQKVFLEIQLMDGYVLIDQDYVFDGQTCAVSMPKFPRPLKIKSEFCHLEVDLERMHQLVNLRISLKNGAFLNMVLTHVSLLCVSIDHATFCTNFAEIQRVLAGDVNQTVGHENEIFEKIDNVKQNKAEETVVSDPASNQKLPRTHLDLPIDGAEVFFVKSANGSQRARINVPTFIMPTIYLEKVPNQSSDADPITYYIKRMVMSKKGFKDFFQSD